MTKKYPNPPRAYKHWGDIYLGDVKDRIEFKTGEAVYPDLNNEDLSFEDHVALSLAVVKDKKEYPCSMRSPSITGGDPQKRGYRPLPNTLAHPTMTPQMKKGWQKLTEKLDLSPIDFRLLTIMKRPKWGHRIKTDLSDFRRAIEEETGFRIKGDWANKLIDLLEPLREDRPNGEQLSAFRYVSDDEKYNELTPMGHLHLEAHFPRKWGAGPVHKATVRVAKERVCNFFGCFSHVVWHGADEVDYGEWPSEHEPDLVIFYPDKEKSFSPFDVEWSMENILCGEAFGNLKEHQDMVFSNLKKNLGLGRRTVFFVSSWWEAYKVKHDSKKLLKEKGLSPKVTVGMEIIPNDALVIIQPIPNPIPTDKEKEELLIEEAEKKAWEALAKDGNVRAQRKNGKVYIRIKNPSDEKAHGEGWVREEDWKRIKRLRDASPLDEETRKELGLPSDMPSDEEWAEQKAGWIKGKWGSTMKKAIQVESKKRSKNRKIKMTEDKIVIGDFEFERTDDSEQRLRYLLEENPSMR